MLNEFPFMVKLMFESLTANIVLQISVHNLLVSNINSSLLPFWVDWEVFILSPTKIYNERETYLKYLDADKMWGKFDQFDLPTLNGP